MRHATILVAILAFVPLTSATAQEPPPVKVGDRVRVTAPDLGRREGTVQLLTTDSLVMRPEYGAWPVQWLTRDSLVMYPEYGGWLVDSVRHMPNRLAIPLASVTRLEVSRGRKSNAGRGAKIGALVLGIPGVIAGLALVGRELCGGLGSCSDVGPEVVVVLGAVGAGTGALIGAVIGYAIRTERWVDLPPDQLRVNLVPQRDGRFGLGLSVRF